MAQWVWSFPVLTVWIGRSVHQKSKKSCFDFRNANIPGGYRPYKFKCERCTKQSISIHQFLKDRYPVVYRVYQKSKQRTPTTNLTSTNYEVLIKNELHQALNDDYLMRHTKDMEHLLSNFRKWGMKKVSDDYKAFKCSFTIANPNWGIKIYQRWHF